MKLSELIFILLKFRSRGIKYVNFWIAYDIPPCDYCSFIFSDKTVTLKNWNDNR